MKDNYFMGADGFVWFTGVVEDRNDPEKLGRVRVRCLGWHSESLQDIPKSDLPWAHVMHPVTDPSMQGLGSTPTFLVEGTWVVGFFLDAVEKQQPLIIGSLPGKPTSVADATKGFGDPNAKYPSEKITHSNHSINEPDTNRLAQGIVSETHQSLIRRRKNKLGGASAVPMADRPGLLNSTEFSTRIPGGAWSEPHPKSVFSDQDSYPSSQYPFNHVFESESGHIFEIDDTPDQERLFKEHMSGTFEEIHPQGTRVVKVVYDDYEIIAKNKKIVINASNEIGGALDLSVYGSVRQFVTGDYTLDIGGNFIRRVGKSEIVKIGAGDAGGNLECEIRGNYSINVSKDYLASIGTGSSGGNLTTTVTGNERRDIGGEQDVFVVKDIFVASNTASVTHFATTNMSIVGGQTIDIQSGGTTTHGSADAVTINYETSLSETVGSGGITQTTTGSVTETYGSLATTISGTTQIKHSGVATYHYTDKFQERIEKEHEVTKLSGTDFDNFFTEASRTAKDPATEIAGIS